MNHLEIIRIRLYQVSDGDQVTVLFQQFKENFSKTGDRDMMIALLKNKHVENDWSIHLASLKKSANREVTDLATLLSEAFRTIGMVNRDVWQPVILRGIDNNHQIQPLSA